MKKIVDEWAKKGHRCIVIVPFPIITYLRKHIEYKPKHYQDEVAQDVFVDVYSPRYINTKLTIVGFSFTTWLASNAVEKQIKRLGIAFDFLYCHFFSSALKGFRYAEKNGVPFYIATGESEIEPLQKPFRFFSWDLFRAKTNGIIAVSSKNKDEARKMGYIDEDKCIVLPNGTDTTLFKPLNKVDCRKQLGLPQDAFIVSCVGFICERKGQNRLLEAVRMMNKGNVKLLYIGKTAKVDPFILEGNEILFKDSINNKEMPTYLCASDIFCLPTRAEGCCNAIIEALACGLPVVSSDLPFNWDILNGSNSIMIDPNNVQEIADAIEVLYSDSDKRNTLSVGALKKARILDIHQRAKRILKFMEKNRNIEK
ncbi:MAG: glycosyltransferase family 4 protein [Bacteroidaceae bacterium]|nr:glycosyltransferase family 4 protein [Bacteroidaceae bacterium]